MLASLSSSSNGTVITKHTPVSRKTKKKKTFSKCLKTTPSTSKQTLNIKPPSIPRSESLTQDEEVVENNKQRKHTHTEQWRLLLPA
jgi:hypothetical protein